MVQHVIIGGGPAATNAIETIRQFESQPSQITLVSDEPAHSRMALPYWLAGKIPEQHTYTGDDKYFQNLDVHTHIGQRVISVDVGERRLELSDGASITYDNLLMATGSSPLNPPIPGADRPGVQALWTLADTKQVLDATESLEKPRVVLVGAGFIGFIVLNAMFKRGWDLTVVEREPQVLPRMLDAGAAGLVHAWLEKQGVAAHLGTTVKAIHASSNGGNQVELEDGQLLESDIVILATGIRANVDLATGTPIDVDQGILVNDQMQTNVNGVYAAGDVAQGPILHSRDRAIHAIQTTAVDHGRVAGANMAGHEVHYPGSLLMNVVDVCGLQCASFGDWSSEKAGSTLISNETAHVYRKYLWHDDRMIGAIFTGQPNDLGMLNDVGMVKGILQTGSALSQWKDYLHQNPFDVRRVYIAKGVAAKLAASTLTGRPAQARQFRYGNAKVETKLGPSHVAYVSNHDSA